MKSEKIRQLFYDFFIKHGHTKVPSSSLIPVDDPTLLFTNAGMNQFKDVFLGKEERPYSRAVSIQKCMRAGGKQSDLENVGKTKRHLTFFEMMGNFSFGDFFKEDAMKFAWEFLTTQMNLDPNDLYISVYEEDDEAYKLWQSALGIPNKRIIKLGKADNFWQMGDTGPCGPCSEIYLDRGIKSAEDVHAQPGDDSDRFLEVWNLVFMQYDRQPDGTLVELAKKSVDTGMGLERLCAIMQHTDSVFETDLFVPIISAIENVTNCSYEKASSEQRVAFRAVADHVRAICFAVADGGMPSNEGGGYVLRKIIRRATLLGQRFKRKQLFPPLSEQCYRKNGRNLSRAHHPKKCN